MSEESAPSEPPPPDIRPFGRFYPTSTKHDSAVKHLSSTTSTRFGHNYAIEPWFLLVALAISAVPVSAASVQSSAGPDPYTSYPQNNKTKSTPILDVLGYLFTFLLDNLFNLIGVHHVSTEGVRGFAKRLDQTGKIEAGMIPVLVALSGTFAGLTLG